MDLPTRLAHLQAQSVHRHPDELVTVHCVLVTGAFWTRYNLSKVLRVARRNGVMIQHDQVRGLHTVHEIIMTGRIPAVLTALQLGMRWSARSTCIS